MGNTQRAMRSRGFRGFPNQPASAVLGYRQHAALILRRFRQLSLPDSNRFWRRADYHDGRVTSSTGPASAHAYVSRVVSDDSG